MFLASDASALMNGSAMVWTEGGLPTETDYRRRAASEWATHYKTVNAAYSLYFADMDASFRPRLYLDGRTAGQD